MNLFSTRRRALLALAASLAAVASCGTKGADFTGSFAFLPRHPEPGTACAESQNIAVISDTHAHHLYTRGDLYQTVVGDDLTGSAIRAPQTDLYGPSLQTSLIASYTRGVSALVHAGDTVDVSCLDEFETFARVMGSSRVPWFLAPGNHDGYHFGVDDSPLTRGAWANACHTSAPMTKDVFVERYLGALAAQAARDPGIAAFAASPRPADGALHQFKFGGAALLQRVAWHLYKSADAAPGRWSSFVAQEIDITAPASAANACDDVKRAAPKRTLAILVDTSSFAHAPSLTYPKIGGTGSGGEISPEQQAVVRAWAAEARAEGARVVVVGHHPSSLLDPSSQQLLGDVHPVLYVSSHDHNGKWLAFTTGAVTTAELNVGSMIDVPIDVRTMTLQSTGGRLVVDAPLERFDTSNYLALAKITACNQHGAASAEPWEAVPGDPDAYLSYKQLGLVEPTKSAANIMSVALASRGRFARFGHVVPASWPADLPIEDVALTVTEGRVSTSPAASRAVTLDDKIALLQRLEAAVSGARTEPPEAKEQFEACQAYWASQYEVVGYRRPAVDTWTVILPPEN